MLRTRFYFAMLLFSLFPLVIFSQGYYQQFGSAGTVDWTNQVIRATGIGAPNVNLPLPQQRAGALRAAQMDALRKLLEMVRGINLNAETVVENAIVTSDVIRSSVEGAVRGYRIVDTRYMSSGDVEVDVEVPLTGILMDVLLPPPQAFGGGTWVGAKVPVCPLCGQPWPSGKPVPPGVTLSTEDWTGEEVSGVVSGLIVDARGLGVRPAMAPRILDENGNEIYGSKFVSREYAVDVGMVGYEKDIDRAQKNERVASTPLIVKAIRVSGPNQTDVVISNADAQKIHNAARHMNFLQQCKVMFVLD